MPHASGIYGRKEHKKRISRRLLNDSAADLTAQQSAEPEADPNLPAHTAPHPLSPSHQLKSRAFS